MDQRTF